MSPPVERLSPADGNRVDQFFRLHGDSDADRDVDALDRIQFNQVRRGDPSVAALRAVFDYNGDGAIN